LNIHLNTIAKRQREDKKANKMSSEHRCLSQEEKEEEAKEELKEEEPFDVCEGSFPDSNYPPPPILEEQAPGNLPCAEDQEMPAEDEWFCPHCAHSPCSFLQWQEEL
jgi:hypothetical protein